MTPEEEKLLQRFEVRVHDLLARYAAQQKECARLAAELSQSRAQEEALRERLAQAEQQYGRLRTVRLLQVGDDDVKDARSRLSRLIREVDKCIALLNV